MKLQTALLALSLMAPACFAANTKAASADPVVWGILSQNAGCVIFKEGRKTTGMFWGVAVTTKTVSKLTLIETQNYTFDQKEVIETQENLNSLMQIAQKDHIKFVKIPEKYSPDLLDKARAVCKSDQ